MAEFVVRLLIFSGRPDPEWSITGEEADRVAGFLESATGNKERAQPAPPRLGYRGFLVRRLDTEERDEFTVHNGVVRDGRGDAWSGGDDLESFLLAQAEERGHGDAIEALGGR